MKQSSVERLEVQRAGAGGQRPGARRRVGRRPERRRVGVGGDVSRVHVLESGLQGLETRRAYPVARTAIDDGVPLL